MIFVQFFTSSIKHEHSHGLGEADQEESLTSELHKINFFFTDDLSKVHVIVLAEVDAVHCSEEVILNFCLDSQYKKQF